MAIFNSYVSHYQRVYRPRLPGIHPPDSAIRAQPIVEAAVEASTPASGCKIAARLRFLGALKHLQ